MADTLAFAHYLILKSETGQSQYAFQNYWVNETARFGSTDFSFMPFAFAGTTISKTGDNQPATLVFPNNGLSRGWAEVAVENRWIADARTMIVNDPDDKTNVTQLNQYVGQVVSAGWDTTALSLQMASVLDAVGADVPRKRLTQSLVGHLPLTSRVRVQ